MRAIRCGDHISRRLVARLLKRRNGRSRRHAGAGRSVRDVAVRGRLLHLFDLHLQDVVINAAHRRKLDFLNPLVVQRPFHAHNRLLPVHQLILVDIRGRRDEEPLLRGHHRVLQDVPAQRIDVDLRVFADRNVAEPRRSALLGVEHIQHDRILPIGIESRLCVLRIVLTCVEQHIPNELGIVQRRRAARRLDLVIPVHHHGFLRRVDRIVVNVLFHVDGVAAHLPGILRILRVECFLIHQLHDEQVL